MQLKPVYETRTSRKMMDISKIKKLEARIFPEVSQDKKQQACQERRHSTSRENLLSYLTLLSNGSIILLSRSTLETYCPKTHKKAWHSPRSCSFQVTCTGTYICSLSRAQKSNDSVLSLPTAFSLLSEHVHLPSPLSAVGGTFCRHTHTKLNNSHVLEC